MDTFWSNLLAGLVSGGVIATVLWLEAYERERKSQKPEAEQSSFTFVGPDGYGFPHEAEIAFERARDETYARLLIGYTQKRRATVR